MQINWLHILKNVIFMEINFYSNCYWDSVIDEHLDHTKLYQLLT